MTAIYTPDETNNPTSYTEPEDGEAATVASILVFVEGVADKAHHVLEGNATFTGNKSGFTVATASTISFQAAVTHTRLCPSNALGIGSSGCVPGIANTDIEPSSNEFFPITIPNGATITGVRARINPADDALPTTNFTLAVIKREKTTTTQTSIGSTVDPLTGASYQAVHDVTVTGMSEVVNYSSFIYFIRCTGDTGGDEDNVVLLELEITYTTASIDKGG